jgi:hypothetical protein
MKGLNMMNWYTAVMRTFNLVTDSARCGRMVFTFQYKSTFFVIQIQSNFAWLEYTTNLPRPSLIQKHPGHYYQ